eukprot:6462081-Amphidinium_carterae.2
MPTLARNVERIALSQAPGRCRRRCSKDWAAIVACGLALSLSLTRQLEVSHDSPSLGLAFQDTVFGVLECMDLIVHYAVRAISRTFPAQMQQ